VLALGLARDLSAWVVDWLLAVCPGGAAELGPIGAVLDAANGRADLLGRRSAVSNIHPGYV